ncbi:MAG: hypothetical protein CMJ94_09090 [Planctomycetes bacterium]|nr:hypothetical protein [Planctomycetota bacterium]
MSLTAFTLVAVIWEHGYPADFECSNPGSDDAAGAPEHLIIDGLQSFSMAGEEEHGTLCFSSVRGRQCSIWDEVPG